MKQEKIRMQKVCCVCHKVKVDNQWIKKPVNFEDSSHGYCPVCYGRTLAVIREMNNPRLDKQARVAM